MKGAQPDQRVRRYQEKAVETPIERHLHGVTRRLAEALQPERIVLFGSQAYGRPSPESDVDLLIVMNSDERPAARAARVSRLLRPRPFPIDALVRTPEEIKHRLEMGDQFIRMILERGRVLYERDVS